MPALINALAHIVQSLLQNLAGQSTTVTSAAFDTIDYDGQFRITQSIGLVSGTSPTLDGKLTHSDTSGGTYTDVTGATFTQVTASNSRQTLLVERKGLKRFVKYVGTIGGTTPAFSGQVLFDGVKKVSA